MGKNWKKVLAVFWGIVIALLMWDLGLMSYIKLNPSSPDARVEESLTVQEPSEHRKELSVSKEDNVNTSPYVYKANDYVDEDPYNFTIISSHALSTGAVTIEANSHGAIFSLPEQYNVIVLKDILSNEEDIPSFAYHVSDSSVRIDFDKQYKEGEVFFFIDSILSELEEGYQEEDSDYTLIKIRPYSDEQIVLEGSGSVIRCKLPNSFSSEALTELATSLEQCIVSDNALVINYGKALKREEISSLMDELLGVVTSYTPDVSINTPEDIYVPSVETVDKEPEVYIPSEQYDEDFWADFYVAGEDELLFEDGIYYMDLYINNEASGAVAVSINDQIPYLFTSEIKTIVSESLTTEAYNRIFLGQGDLMAMEDFIDAQVDCVFDLDNYCVFLEFSLSDMPLTVISLSKPYRRNSSSYAISGAVTLEPSSFSIRTNWNFNLGLNVKKDSFRWMFDIYSSNTVSIFDNYLDFSYALSFYDEGFAFNFNNLVLRHDFKDEMLRLSMGHITSALLSPNGRSFGISLKKGLEYGDGTYTRKSPYSAVLTIEKESLVEVINEGKVLYSKILNPGNYRIEDFILFTGVNRIVVKISPTDGSLPEEKLYEFSYYSSILDPGEFYYSLSLAFGSERLSPGTAYRNGAWGFELGDYKYQYDWRNVAFSFIFNYGLNSNMMLSSAIAFSNNPNNSSYFNPSAKINNELTIASSLGTTRINLNLTERMYDSVFGYPQVYARLSHQFNTSWKFMSNLNFNVTYNSPYDYENGQHLLSLGLNASGRVGFIGYGIGSTFNLYSDNIVYSPYSIYATLSMSFNPGISLSLQFSGQGNYKGEFNPSASIYASISFDSNSISTSASGYGSYISGRTSFGSHSLSASIGMPGWNNFKQFADASRSRLSGNYSTSNRYFSLALGLNAPLSFNSFFGNVSLSTRTLFSDGMFMLSSSIPDKVLLVRQKGLLKGNDVTFSSSDSSSYSEGIGLMGTKMFSSLRRDSSNIMIYSTPQDSFSQSNSFAVHIPGRDGVYTYRLESEPLYTISAIAEFDDSLWINGTSPVYRVDKNKEALSLSADDSLYLFTDENGRFILTDVEEGTYAFDLPSSDGWILAIFDVDKDLLAYGDMNLYEVDVSKEFDYVPEPYTDIVYYRFSESLSFDAFWNLLYPEMIQEEE